MSRVELCVQRLRLLAPRDVSAPALRSRVEDALRISSMPTSLAHRFVLLRRLRLVLPRGASAQSLALQLEREWHAVAALAQPMDDAADEAPVVWATDEAAARLLLLRRWLDARDAAAWYWQRLLPTVHAAMPLAQRLRALLFEPFDSAPDAAASARGQREHLWRQALPSIEAAGLLPALVPRLSVAQADGLRAGLARCGASPVATPHAAGPPSVPALPGDAPLRRPALPRLAPAEGGVITASTSPAPGNRPTVPAMPMAPAATVVRGEVDAPMDAPVAAGVSPAITSAADTGYAVHATTATGPPPLRPRMLPLAAAHMAFDGGRDTAWAGLWFLLPMLLREGLARHPAPARLLAAVLQRAEARHGLDAATRDWIGQVASSAVADELSPSDADAWWRLVRLLSVRRARLPLRRVLHRPGRVWMATHRVDLVLPLQHADVRIRRAGFDIDPGYVPWLDTVIRFHYL